MYTEGIDADWCSAHDKDVWDGLMKEHSAMLGAQDGERKMQLCAVCRKVLRRRCVSEKGLSS